MPLMQRGDDVQVARSPYAVNSLKKQGYREVSQASESSAEQPTEPPKKPKKGGKKS